jgi:indole-3-glycerol phosphate synthase
VKNIDDVKRYRDSGADVVLVGEALVTGDWQKLIPQIVAVS